MYNFQYFIEQPVGRDLSSLQKKRWPAKPTPILGWAGQVSLAGNK
jgi:hypothetical protein